VSSLHPYKCPGFGIGDFERKKTYEINSFFQQFHMAKIILESCREEWKQLLRMARNCHILHMPME
jgi:hypothetical protein